MNRWLYSLFYQLILPFLLARLWWRGRHNAAYRQRWGERFARYDLPPLAERSVVFHAVSVGEVHAAVPLIEQFLRVQPQTPVVVTTSTPTGSERVTQLFGARVHHVYLPYDITAAVGRFFDHFNPGVMVLLETELWPILLECAQKRSCPVLLVNARLSAKSFAAYRRIAGLCRNMLQQLAVVAAQAEADAARFIALGLPVGKSQVIGSLKFDMAIQQDKVLAAQRLKELWQDRPVWIAASTREGEDPLVLQAFASVLQHAPSALLVLVPRHPERFVLAATTAQALGMQVVSQSSKAAVSAATNVLIGDTLGDMHFYYSLADVAFVGGSLVNTGCQNLIEPAALGLPVVTGPSLYNFQAASDALQSGGGMQVVNDAEGLGAAVSELFKNLPLRQSMGRKAKNVVAANIGATERTLELILRYSRSH